MASSLQDVSDAESMIIDKGDDAANGMPLGRRAHGASPDRRDPSPALPITSRSHQRSHPDNTRRQSVSSHIQDMFHTSGLPTRTHIFWS